MIKKRWLEIKEKGKEASGIRLCIQMKMGMGRRVVSGGLSVQTEKKGEL